MPRIDGLAYLRLIDTSTRGQRYDVTPLFADARAFARLIEDLAERCGDLKYDVVAGIDALGFILGAALALHVRRGFVPIRKGGKLPVAVERVDFADYSGQEKALELRVGAVSPGTRVLVVDEWIETGAQATATIALVERQRGVVAGVAGIHMDDNPVTRGPAGGAVGTGPGKVIKVDRRGKKVVAQETRLLPYLRDVGVEVATIDHAGVEPIDDSGDAETFAWNVQPFLEQRGMAKIYTEDVGAARDITERAARRGRCTTWRWRWQLRDRGARGRCCLKAGA
ncbi:MAG TPA: hypothetical protein VFN74_08585 [Chloroflexota bacterium]|nr:hypothetical protein [Chloroflexota bacterium]